MRDDDNDQISYEKHTHDGRGEASSQFDEEKERDVKCGIRGEWKRDERNNKALAIESRSARAVNG